MKSNPIKEWVIVLVLLAGLAVPLVRITSTVPHDHSDSEAAATDDRVDVFAELRFVHEPLYFDVEQHGQRIWLKAESGKEYAQQFEVTMEDHVCELLLHVHWPDDVGKTAVEFTIEPDGLERRQVTIWGGKDLEEIVEFNWK